MALSIIFFLFFTLPTYGHTKADKEIAREEYCEGSDCEGKWTDSYDENKKKDALYLSFNVNKGSRLELSDGSAYEVNPEDRVYSVYWITPFPVELGKTGDRDYPIKITNLNTLSFVRAKKITIAQLRETSRVRTNNSKINDAARRERQSGRSFGTISCP